MDWGTQATSEGGKGGGARGKREGALKALGHLAGWTVCARGRILPVGLGSLFLDKGPGLSWGTPFPPTLGSPLLQEAASLPHLSSLGRGKSLIQLRACPGIQGLAALHPFLLCPQVDKIKLPASYKQLLAVT